MNNFYEGFEKSDKHTLIEKKKIYPNWVLKSKHPDLTTHFYDIVEQLFADGKIAIKAKNFKKASDVIFSQAKVCKLSNKHRNALQNHPLVVKQINKRNAELQVLLDGIKKKKSLVRKTKSQIKSERDYFKAKLKHMVRDDLEVLLQSELIVSQADAMQQIAFIKLENSDLRYENVKLVKINHKLQNKLEKLEQKLFINKNK